MGNYLSYANKSNIQELLDQQNKIEDKNLKFSDQKEIIIEFYKSRRDNKFENLEKAIGLK